MPRTTWDNLDERRRERVLHAAMAEFGRRGYSGGSLNVISREAGVAKGSLFQYFEDKFDFFAHVAEQTSLSVYAAMTPYLTGPAAGETFLNYFARLIDTWMQYMGDHPLERGVTAATNLELDPQIRRVIREPVYRLYSQGLRPLLDEGVAAGEISPDADINALLALLILLLPHLALAPFEPGFDAALPLYQLPRQERVEHASRLIATLFAPALVRPVVGA